MRKKKRILSLLMFLIMLFTCIIGSTSMKVNAATEYMNNIKGEPTKIYASAFAQNTDDWTWISIGDTFSLLYQDVINLDADNNNNEVLASSNSTANFGIQISDGNLESGDSSTLKFNIGTVKIEADGYEDLIINLNKDYSESYLAEAAAWGLTGNNTQILLNDYLPKDSTEKENYLHKITNITADITLLDYEYSKATPQTPPTGSTIYTEKGAVTKIYASAFAQNTDDWNWISIGENSDLLYQDVTNLNVNNNTDALQASNSTANFGINIVDGHLDDGDSNILKFNIGDIIVKADGYDDLVVNLNKDYSESNLASKVSWGLTGNNTQILLNDYLPTNPIEKVNYLHKITSITADITLLEYQYIKAVEPEPEFPDDYTHPTTMRGILAMDLVKDMKLGWNLGNSLEATGGETGWGNPLTSKKMIDELKKAGFNTIRIPVRWDEKYTDDNYTIDPAYMARVETVVNYALSNDMYAIVNIHHNKIQSEMNEANKANVINEGCTVWKQVSDHFKDYSDKLIFETINEPRFEEDWIGTTEYYNVLNEYNAKVLSVMRETGGNNDKRLVMLPTYCAAADYEKISAMVVPNDDNVAVSIHAYSPYEFALNEAPGSQSTFGDADKIYLDKIFRLLDKTFKQKGIPVVMGEFGAIDKNNLQDRINFTKYYTQLASSHEIPCFWWDNSNSAMTSKTNGFALFNRKTLKFVYPEIVDALFEGWNNPKDVTNYDENILFNGIANSSKWSQALTLYKGLDFMDVDFVNKLAIAVEYTSEKSPQLVLSGNVESTNWVRVAPSITKSNETTSIAYFTLKDMVTAYKNALTNYDSYGQALPGLHSIIVGDQGADLTVIKVYKIYVQKLEEKVSESTINEENLTLYINSETNNSATIYLKLPEELEKVVDNGLSTSTISYNGSNDKIAIISQDGKITAVGVGTTTIITTVTAGESIKSFITTIEVKDFDVPLLLGDLDGNGLINSLDEILMRQYISDDSITINRANADMNNDGEIDILDFMLLRANLYK